MKNKKYKKNSAGFTLIETIIYTTIIGGILAAFISFSFSVKDPRDKIYATQEVQANAKFIALYLEDLIESSDGINIGTSVFNSNPGSLSLQMVSSTINPTIISVSSGDLQITQGLNIPFNISSEKVKISNLVFSRLTGRSPKENVVIDLEVEYDAPTSSILYAKQSLSTVVNVKK